MDVKMVELSRPMPRDTTPSIFHPGDPCPLDIELRRGMQFNGAAYEAVVHLGAALRALMYNTELVAGLMQTWTPNSPDRQLHIAGWRG